MTPDDIPQAQNSEDKTVKYPVTKKDLESSKADSEEKTLEYPLPYDEMEKHLSEYDAIRKSILTRNKQEEADDEEAETKE